MPNTKPTLMIHRATHAAGFLAAYAEATGRTLLSVVADYVAPDSVLAIVLGGSIPLGIATIASDIDVLVLVGSAETLRTTAPGAKSALFSGRFASSDELAIGTAVVRHADTEVDFQFVLASRLDELLRMSKASGVALTIQQRQIVGRLRKGWLLDRETWPEEAKELLDDGFDIHCATQSLIMSYRWLVDGKVSESDNWRLSLTMARQSVEKAFEAYFASLGYSSLGFKWLRFLDRRFDEITGAGRGKLPVELAQRGVELLFPIAKAEAVPAYLASVETFVGDMRKVMEGNIRYKLAFDVAPHLARPRIVDGSERAS